MEARERYKSALDYITGHYLFDTTESRNNLQVNKTPLHLVLDLESFHFYLIVVFFGALLQTFLVHFCQTVFLAHFFKHFWRTFAMLWRTFAK